MNNADIIKKMRASYPNQTIGFTCSCFDLMHAGHHIMLKDAKNQCDILVVGLQQDPTLDQEYRIETSGKNKNIPIQSYDERKIQIEGCRYVDYILEYSTETQLYDLVSDLQPDVRILGSDWNGKQYTGYDLGIPIHWHDRSHNFSTSSLRQRTYNAELQKLSQL